MRSLGRGGLPGEPLLRLGELLVHGGLSLESLLEARLPLFDVGAKPSHLFCLGLDLSTQGAHAVCCRLVEALRGGGDLLLDLPSLTGRSVSASASASTCASGAWSAPRGSFEMAQAADSIEANARVDTSRGSAAARTPWA